MLRRVSGGAAKEDAWSCDMHAPLLQAGPSRRQSGKAMTTAGGGAARRRRLAPAVRPATEGAASQHDAVKRSMDWVVCGETRMGNFSSVAGD